MAFRSMNVSRARRAAPARLAGRNVVAQAENAIAGPYARGLLELAEERDILDTVYGDLMSVQTLIAAPAQPVAEETEGTEEAPAEEEEASSGSSSQFGDMPNFEEVEDAPVNDLREFLLTGGAGLEKTKEIIDSLGKEASLSEETVNFLKVLADTGRLDILDDVIDSFEETYNNMTDTTVVKLTSAIRLDQEQEYELAKCLQEATKSKNIKIKPTVDEGLIGGFIVEFDGQLIDLTIKGDLEKIGMELREQAMAQ